MCSTLIADDHSLVRLGMEMLVKEIHGSNSDVEFASSGKEVLKMLESRKYEMLITDINMPDTDGMEMLANVLSISPDLRVLIVSVNAEKTFAPWYLRGGAYGYIGKDKSDKEIKEAIRMVAIGKKYISDNQAHAFANILLNGKSGNPFDSLSAREFEVSSLLLKGDGALEIANKLGISPSTASTHRCRVFEKLGVNNLMELNRLARQFDFVD